MKVLLANVGNPDFGQDPNRQMYGTPTPYWKEVHSLKEASEACQFYISRYDLGGGNWTGGEVKDKNKVIANVSYNGRVWNADTKEEIK